VVAILLAESEAERLIARIADADAVGIGAPTLAEAGLVLQHKLGRRAAGMLKRFLQEANVRHRLRSRALARGGFGL
jgi:uncharacterized protein with PIN domain